MTAMTPSALITAMASTRVVVIGDIMLDRFVAGYINRISPEAPVPVLSLAGETNMPGFPPIWRVILPIWVAGLIYRRHRQGQ